MVASVPARAPRGPPLTGESIIAMFFFASSAAISFTAFEPIVDIST